MTMRFGIKEEHWQKIIALFKKNPKIDKVILFGSRAMGNFKNGSDIDIALVGKNLDQKRDIYTALFEYEELYLPWKFDMLDYNNLSNQDLKDHIDRVGMTLWSRQ